MATAITPDRPGQILGNLAAHLQAHPDLIKAHPAAFVTDRGVHITINADHYLTWRHHAAAVRNERLTHPEGAKVKHLAAIFTIGDFDYTLEAASYHRTEAGFRAIVGWGAFDQAQAV